MFYFSALLCREINKVLFHYLKSLKQILSHLSCRIFDKYFINLLTRFARDILFLACDFFVIKFSSCLKIILKTIPNSC